MKFKDLAKIQEYCMEKPCAYESRPFGPDLICYRVSGKIFCQLSLKEEWFKATLKTNPDTAIFYRQAYPDIVVRGYHCPPVQQPYWNTLELAELSQKVIFQMIDEAYDEVVSRLTRKEQARLPEKSLFRFVKKDGSNQDFIKLCAELDADLEQLVGKKIDRTKYAKFNTSESIHDAIVIYKNDIPVGSGAFRFYDDETAELKRVFVKHEFRGFGLSKELLWRLEAEARIQGYRYMVLETGELLEASVRLYKRMGYQVIPNYGPYADMKDSLCMQRKL